MNELIELLKTRWVSSAEIRKILNINHTKLPWLLIQLGDEYPDKPYYKIIDDTDFLGVKNESI